MNRISMCALAIFVAQPALAQDNDPLASASALRPSQYTAKALIGAKIVNQRNENLGDVNDIVIGTDNSVVAIVAGVGGFLGVGEKNVAIPMNLVQRQQLQDGTQKVLVPLHRDGLSAAPAFKTGEPTLGQKVDQTVGTAKQKVMQGAETVREAASTGAEHLQQGYQQGVESVRGAYQDARRSMGTAAQPAQPQYAPTPSANTASNQPLPYAQQPNSSQTQSGQFQAQYPHWQAVGGYPPVGAYPGYGAPYHGQPYPYAAPYGNGAYGFHSPYPQQIQGPSNGYGGSAAGGQISGVVAVQGGASGRNAGTANNMSGGGAGLSGGATVGGSAGGGVSAN